MPRNDGSGPMGYGPKTGGGFGSCVDGPDPGNLNMSGRGFRKGYGRRRGFERGMGMGRGRGCFGPFNPPATREEERAFLEKHAEALQSRLDAVKQELDDFETEQTRES
ncbi:conserved hypothetical protein [Candidatus Desulfarcum epimagneticum]|uniref:Cytoplasmic protein n=1 Tax=uncultured Desulfobacteraceae bacterium TaxID=218296 RepID=A0A484HET5_9BACT|nr:conserved hypothetical protein [uncultured Desulfobacteraceae bacterium]